MLVRVGESQVLVGIGAARHVPLTPLAAPIVLKAGPRTPAFAERLRDIMKRPGASGMMSARPEVGSQRRAPIAACAMAMVLLRRWPCCRCAAQAQAALPAVAIKTAADGAQTYSLTFQMLILMTVLTLLPALLLAMTAFTRIIIVLSILRQALGMATTPSNQILTGLALFMTFFVMSSTIEQSYANGIKPYLDGQLAGEVASDRTVQPLKKFMLAQTRENDLQLFSKLSGKPQFASADDVPLTVLIPDLHDQRAENRVSNRLHGVHTVPGHRSGGGQRADVDGHDDAVAGSGVAAVQDHVVRGGGRLDAAHRHAGREFSPMTPENVMDLAHKMLLVTSMIAAPLLLIALITGLVIGMLQAATQINESTLSFIPKLLLLVLTLFVAGPWILRVLIDFTRDLYASIPDDDRLGACKPLTLNAADVSMWVSRMWWPVLRIGGFVLAAPRRQRDGDTAPGQDRAVAGAGISDGAAGADAGRRCRSSPAAGMLAAVQEVLIGVAIGMVVQLAFEALVFAGQSISLTMGLGFATLVDPQRGAQTAGTRPDVHDLRHAHLPRDQRASDAARRPGRELSHRCPSAPRTWTRIFCCRWCCGARGYSMPAC